MKLLKELTYDQYNDLQASAHANLCGVCGGKVKTNLGEWVQKEDGSIWSLGKNCLAKIQEALR